MTLSSFASLFGAMLVLALTPGISVFTVTARTLAGGLSHGLATILGIILGDIVFVLFVVYGLGYIAESFAPLFGLLNIVGGIYLLGMGIRLWRSSSTVKFTAPTTAPNLTLSSSVTLGLFITLGNQKAILFYLGFLPAFLDLTQFTPLDTALTILSATLALGGVMTGYALLAGRLRVYFSDARRARLKNRLTCALLIGTGIGMALARRAA